jgi:small subunit ribosomal protein S18
MAAHDDNHYDDSDDERGRGGRGGGGGGAGGRSRRKMCRFCAGKTVTLDYKNSSVLKYYMTDRGKMIPRRITGNCAKHQRALAVAIKRSRMIALMPFSVTGR